MAKRGSTSRPTTSSAAEPPRIEVTCAHCNEKGLAGSQISPYVFKLKGERMWLHSGCMPEAWKEWRAANP